MIRRQEWTDDAACAGWATNTFFIPDYPAHDIPARNAAQGAYKRQVKWLRKTCAVCPVLSKCRLASIGELGGMWAGVTEVRRQQIRKELYPGQRPEDVLEKALDALDLMDRGVSWGDALDSVGLEDHEWFLEYDMGVTPEPVTRQEAA